MLGKLDLLHGGDRLLCELTIDRKSIPDVTIDLLWDIKGRQYSVKITMYYIKAAKRKIKTYRVTGSLSK